jgi:S-formylglutathione hydrolase FrmB
MILKRSSSLRAAVARSTGANTFVSLVLAASVAGGCRAGSDRSKSPPPQRSVEAARVDVAPDGTSAVDAKPAIAENPTPNPELCSGDRFELVTITAPEVAGKAKNPIDRRFCVRVPASYATDKTRRYPVIFLLPGLMSNDVMRLVGNASLAEIFDRFASTIGEAILVGVDGSDNAGSTYFVDSPTSGKWETFATTQMTKAIDERFRTHASPRSRALFGHSTGGFNAMSLALRHPDVWSVVMASSPDGLDLASWLLTKDGEHFTPLATDWLLSEEKSGGPGQFASCASDWSPDESARGYAFPLDPASGQLVPSVWKRWMSNSPSEMLKNPAIVAAAKANLAGRVLLIVGDHDEADLTRPTLRFHEELDAAGIAHRFQIAAGGHHEPPERLETEVRFVLQMLAKP